MIRRPPRSTLSSSSAASDVYKRQGGALLCMAGTEDSCFKVESHRGDLRLNQVFIPSVPRPSIQRAGEAIRGGRERVKGSIRSAFSRLGDKFKGLFSSSVSADDGTQAEDSQC
eukprot:TRINITY_DN9153_c0_g1_i1.p1 TRINITY_DN9153_c0_g1~~TRINITY_DN9153_c0_g1_i1.p1  ORF type:complete len:113 (+),score=24.64 TRINITY_DN9153_c0_g1_i1:102-440(+)